MELVLLGLKVTPRNVHDSKVYIERKETIERIFADMKELCGIRYAHYRGNEGVKAQALITGAALNIKKIAMVLSK